jgi:hypothetical protein
MIQSIAYTSRWETDRVSGGVTGVGMVSISFSYCGMDFNIQVDRFHEVIDPNNWNRSGTDRVGHLSPTIIGYYEQKIQITESQVLDLLAHEFEYEGEPLNPYRFQGHRMFNAIKAYARITKKDLKVFVRGYLYPLPHPHYGDSNVAYKEEREKVLRRLGV